MEQATTTKLAVPLLEHVGRDLLIVPTDGSRAERLSDYFPDVGTATIASMLAAINHDIALNHVAGERSWARGGDGADVMLGGDDALFLAGAAGNDVVIAGAGSDWIDGGAGDDHLVGGAGDDIVSGGSGDDVMHCAAGDNVMYGGDGHDILLGGTGSDQLYGGPGDDWLIGNGGDDSYFFAKGDGQDCLFNQDEHGNDTLYMVNVAAEQLWLLQDGNDLEVRLIETGEGVVLHNWFDLPAQRVDTIAVFSPSGEHAGRKLGKDRVDDLVQAMAAFQPPPVGSTALPADYRQVLAPLIASSWT